jgi:FKBP-type peptidyl-prolyl cis-trans isomerase
VDAVPTVEFIGARGTGEEIRHGDVITIHFVAWSVTPQGEQRFGGSAPAAWSGTRLAFDPLPADPDARNAAPRPFVTEAGLGKVVDGLDRVLTQLRVGDHAKALVPSDIAYGDRGFPPIVPQGADVRYEIWVLKRVPPLTWETIRRGDGPAAVLGRPLLIHTKVTLPDGTVVDDTKRPKKDFPEGSATAFLLNGSNPSEALDRILPQLRVGDHVRFTVPWELDLGPEPRKYEGVAIPAMTDLTYEIDVVFLPDTAPVIKPAADDPEPAKDTK